MADEIVFDDFRTNLPTSQVVQMQKSVELQGTAKSYGDKGIRGMVTTPGGGCRHTSNPLYRLLIHTDQADPKVCQSASGSQSVLFCKRIFSVTHILIFDWRPQYSMTMSVVSLLTIRQLGLLNNQQANILINHAHVNNDVIWWRSM